MGILSNLFSSGGSNNILSYCHPLMVDMANEQQRTFEGLVQIFCEDNRLSLINIDTKIVFKSRLIVTMMLPFAYGARGLPEQGYIDLVDLALRIANQTKHNSILLNMGDASYIANSFLSSSMVNMANSYNNANAIDRYCSLIIGLITEAISTRHDILYNHERYMHFIHGNISITFRRAQTIINNI
jgi:hypothetical protein